MAGEVVTAEDLAAFLGVEPEGEPLRTIHQLRAAGIEEICRSTGIDWTQRERVETFNEALRTMVWLSYYAVRDGAKNTQFLQQYLTGLICSLQLCKGEQSSGI